MASGPQSLATGVGLTVACLVLALPAVVAVGGSPGGHSAALQQGGTQQFDIDEWSSSLQVGERGRFVATITNRGNTTVRNAVLVYTGEGQLQPLSREAAIGTLQPGRSDQVGFTFDIPADLDPGRHTLPFVVRYQGPDGQQQTTEPIWIETVVDGEQTFAIENVSSTLRVDDTGTVTAEVVNTGDRTTDGVVVTLEETPPAIVPRETTVATDPLSPGEREQLRFRFDVTADAQSGYRQLSFRVRYRGQEDRVRTTEPIDATVFVARQRDEFSVTAINATVPAGDTDLVTVRVRNRENETLRNVRARLFVDDPLDSDNSEAFVPTLGPNETATLTFQVTPDAGAVPKQYPLLVDFTYEEPSGETVLSDTYFVPLEVVEPPPREFPVPLVPAAVGAIALLAVAIAFWKRGTISRRLRR